MNDASYIISMACSDRNEICTVTSGDKTKTVLKGGEGDPPLSQEKLLPLLILLNRKLEHIIESLSISQDRKLLQHYMSPGVQ